MTDPVATLEVALRSLSRIGRPRALVLALLATGAVLCEITLLMAGRSSAPSSWYPLVYTAVPLSAAIASFWVAVRLVGNQRKAWFCFGLAYAILAGGEFAWIVSAATGPLGRV